MKQKERKKNETDIPTKRLLGDGKLRPSTCLLEGKDEGRRDRGETSCEASAHIQSYPVGEEGAGPLNCTLSDSRTRLVEGEEASCSLVERARCLPVPTISWTPLSRGSSQGRRLERQIHFCFLICFSCFRIELALARNTELSLHLFIWQLRPFLLLSFWAHCWPKILYFMILFAPNKVNTCDEAALVDCLLKD